MEKVTIGAVIYSPQVKVVWDIIADYFRKEGMELDLIFFSNYKDQVDYLLEGKIDIAWNSPLAYVMSDIRSNGKLGYSYMRDTDQDRHSVLVVKKDQGIQAVADLKGKKIGFGAFDSPQARLIPIHFLKDNGLEFDQDYQEERFDIGVGLHGDHVGGEKDAFEALKAGDLDASWMLDLNWEAWVADGTIDPNVYEVLAETPNFDHCIFTLREGFDPEVLKEWERLLDKMDYNNPDHKEMMDLEGLKKWVPGRLEGFKQLQEAVAYLNYSEE